MVGKINIVFPQRTGQANFFASGSRPGLFIRISDQEYEGLNTLEYRIYFD